MDLTGLADIAGGAGVSGLGASGLGANAITGDDEASQFAAIFEKIMQDAPTGLTPGIFNAAYQNAAQQGAGSPKTVTGLLKEYIGNEVRSDDGVLLGVAHEVVLSDNGYYLNVTKKDGSTAKVQVQFTADGNAEPDKALIGQQLAQSIHLQQTQFLNKLMSRSEDEDALSSSATSDLSGLMGIANLKTGQMAEAVTDFNYILNGKEAQGTLGKIHNGIPYLADGTPLTLSFNVV